MRRARRTCAGYGSAFAGRGESINRAIEAFVPLARERGEGLPQHHRVEHAVRALLQVSRGAAARIVAPVAEIQAAAVRSLDRTFTAFAEVADPYIQQSIKRGPSGLDTATEVFPKVTPFFAEHRSSSSPSFSQGSARCAPPTRTSPTRS